MWETDHPVKILNVVCGALEGEARRRDGAASTIPSIPTTSTRCRRRSTPRGSGTRSGSCPIPWHELKLSEFPGLAGYAQGFGTNITFSENIGFLTKNDAKTDATFLVTAHEAAHQWWGNILTPANGPSGDFLSEGMSHFSTLLLFDQVEGSARTAWSSRAASSRATATAGTPTTSVRCTTSTASRRTTTP